MDLCHGTARGLHGEEAESDSRALIQSGQKGIIRDLHVTIKRHHDHSQLYACRMLDHQPVLNTDSVVAGGEGMITHCLDGETRWWHRCTLESQDNA